MAARTDQQPIDEVTAALALRALAGADCSRCHTRLPATGKVTNCPRCGAAHCPYCFGAAATRCEHRMAIAAAGSVDSAKLELSAGVVPSIAAEMLHALPPDAALNTAFGPLRPLISAYPRLWEPPDPGELVPGRISRIGVPVEEVKQTGNRDGSRYWFTPNADAATRQVKSLFARLASGFATLRDAPPSLCGLSWMVRGAAADVLRWSPTTDRLLALGGGRLQVLDGQTGHPLPEYDITGVLDAVWLPAGDLALSTAAGVSVLPADAEQPPRVVELGIAVEKLVTGTDGQWLAGVDRSGNIHVWDVEAGRRRWSRPDFAGMTGGTVALAFSAGGRALAAAAGVLTRRWDVRTGKELASGRSRSWRYAAADASAWYEVLLEDDRPLLWRLIRNRGVVQSGVVGDGGPAFAAGPSLLAFDMTTPGMRVEMWHSADLTPCVAWTMGGQGPARGRRDKGATLALAAALAQSIPAIRRPFASADGSRLAWVDGARVIVAPIPPGSGVTGGAAGDDGHVGPALPTENHVGQTAEASPGGVFVTQPPDTRTLPPFPPPPQAILKGTLFAPPPRSTELPVQTPPDLRTLDHVSTVTAAAFSPDGRRLATALLTGTIGVWPLENSRS